MSNSNGRRRKLRVVRYYRMSTDQQDTSIELQTQALDKRLAGENVKEVAAYTDEGVSGWKERKQHEAMLLAMERGEFDAIAVYDCDRFSRMDAVDAAAAYVKRLKDAGCVLFSAGQGWFDFSKFGDQLRMFVDCEQNNSYVRKLGQRSYSGKRKKALEGKHPCGHIPFGLTLDGDRKYKLGSRQDVALVRLIFDLYLELGSIRQTAATLNKRGRQVRGKPVGHSFVGKVLRNPKYMGTFVWGAEPHEKREKDRFREREDMIVIVDNHPAIIDEATFKRVAGRLAKNKRRTSDSGKDAKFALTGLVRCGHCGASMHGRSSRKGGGRSYRCARYMDGGCPHAPNGSTVTIGAKQLYFLVGQALEYYFLAPDRVEAYRRRALVKLRKQFAGDPAEMEAERKRIETLTRRRKAAYDAIIDESDDKDEVNESRSRWRSAKADLREVEVRISYGAKGDDELALEVSESIQDMAAHHESIQAAIADDDIPSLRVLFGELLAEHGVAVYVNSPDDEGRARNFVERLEIDLASRGDLSRLSAKPEQDARIRFTPAPMMTAAQACEYLDIGNTTLWRWEKAGRIRPALGGGTLGCDKLFLQADIEHLAE